MKASVTRHTSSGVQRVLAVAALLVVLYVGAVLVRGIYDGTYDATSKPWLGFIIGCVVVLPFWMLLFVLAMRRCRWAFRRAHKAGST